MQKKSNNYILYINESEEPSRFTVDLNKEPETPELSEFNSEIQSNNNSRSKKLKSCLQRSGKRISNLFSFKKSKIKKSGKHNFLLPKIEYTAPGRSGAMNLSGPSFGVYSGRVNRLSFFPLFLLAFTIIKNLLLIIRVISWRTGWLVLFLLRLLVFVPKKMFFIIYLFFKIFKKKKILGSKRVIAKAGEIEKEVDKEKKLPAFFKDKEEDKKQPLLSGFSSRRPCFSLIRLKRVLGFTMILVLFAIPLKAVLFFDEIISAKGAVLGASESAVNGILAASQSMKILDFAGAQKDFLLAAENFTKARGEIDDLNGLLVLLGSLANDPEYKMAKNLDHILAAGEAGAEIGKNLASTLEVLDTDTDCKIKELVLGFYAKGEILAELTQRLNYEINSIDETALPIKYQEPFILLKEKSETIGFGFRDFLDSLKALKNLLGLERDRRYLLVFQNNTELRASGGFIGSFSLVDVSNGKIKKIETPAGGSYDTKGGLRERIIAPTALSIVDPAWHFWDANWWPDWSASAEKLMWFFERSQWPSVDGVISFTPTVLEDLLRVVGGVDLSEEYGVVISADNFWEITQAIVEDKTNNDNKPKKIIGDMMGKLLETVVEKLTKETFFSIANVFEKNLKEKHILFYFKDNELKRLVKEYDWDGRVKTTGRDYLQVVHTNIAGEKTDKVIKNIINHSIEIAEDGTIIDSLEIKRIHNGIKGDIFTGVGNNDWLRVYVPSGSELLSASGFVRPDSSYFEDPEEGWKNDPDIMAREGSAVPGKGGTLVYNEFGKTVFANWLQVDPGKTIIARLRYKLPFKVKYDPSETLGAKIENFLNPNKQQLSVYSLMVQKQPGTIGTDYTGLLKLADNHQSVWHYSLDETELSLNGWRINDTLYTDKFWAAIIAVKQ